MQEFELSSISCSIWLICPSISPHLDLKPAGRLLWRTVDIVFTIIQYTMPQNKECNIVCIQDEVMCWVQSYRTFCSMQGGTVFRWASVYEQCCIPDTEYMLMGSSISRVISRLQSGASQPQEENCDLLLPRVWNFITRSILIQDKCYLEYTHTWQMWFGQSWSELLHSQCLFKLFFKIFFLVSVNRSDGCNK